MADTTQHPAITFVQEAWKHIGAGGHSWVIANAPGIGNQAWCAATMCAVARTVGYAGIICPENDYTAGGFGQQVVETYGGQFIAGPGQGQVATPQTGDFILYRGSSGGTYGSGRYSASHIGVVFSVSGTQITTVEGNTGNSQYKSNTYQTNNTYISYYARPNWTKLSAPMIVPGQPTPPTTGESGSGAGGTGIGFSGELYSTESTRADASLREVGFWDATTNKPALTGHIRLAVINYTGMLSDFVKAFGLSTSGSGSGADGGTISGLSGTEQAVFNYLQGKGLSTAACVGIMANIKRESNFQLTALSKDGNASIGLCQWTFGRKTALMQQYPDWATNLTSQMNFLWGELNGSYKSSTLEPIQKVANTLEGAKSACEIWVRHFEIPANMPNEISIRNGFVEDYWERVTLNTTATGTTTTVSQAQGSISDYKGNKKTSGTSITIPSSVAQTGIIANYTSYTRFYSRWSKGTTQRRLADIWNSQGRPSSRGIATINGYYLCAMSPKFGTTGDLVSIVLENGKYINAILGDAKGSDAGSIWGHLFSGKADIVEWESVTDQDSLRSGLSAAGWLNVKVSKVVNYGSFL